MKEGTRKRAAAVPSFRQYSDGGERLFYDERLSDFHGMVRLRRPGR